MPRPFKITETDSDWPIHPCDVPKCTVCEQLGRSIALMAGAKRTQQVRQAIKNTMRGIEGQ